VKNFLEKGFIVITNYFNIKFLRPVIDLTINREQEIINKKYITTISFIFLSGIVVVKGKVSIKCFAFDE